MKHYGNLEFFYLPYMENSKFNPPKKPLYQQAEVKQLSEKAVKNVASVVHVMLNDKK
jgi:hypothetical protein